jgi:hypothetical protein
LHAFRKGARVHVADVTDLDVRQAEQRLDVRPAAAVATHDGDDELVVGSSGGRWQNRAPGGKAGSEDGGLLEENSTID